MVNPLQNKRETWHSLPISEIAAQLKVNLSSGLSENEARQRLATDGPNRWRKEKREPFWEKFLGELREPMILLLLITGVFYAIWGEISDAITIFFVILALNTIEVVNEQRAKKAVRALHKLAEPTTLVLREDRLSEIPAHQIVPGDVILLQAGRRIPADGRLVISFSLAVDESALTGESLPVEKDATTLFPSDTPLAERRNQVYAGTLVTRGRGSAIIQSTGTSTELGRLAEQARKVTQPRTPLQKTMDELSRWLVWLAIGFSVIIPLFGVLLSHQPLKTMFLTGLSLAFATIPEEMPIIITMVLALGAYRLSRKNAIIKRLKVVETLGAITVIATDKTGTLTENRMEVIDFYPETSHPKVLEIGVLCNDALQNSQGFSGDPLETALLQAAERNGVNITSLHNAYPLQDEFTFDTIRKRMSVIRKRGSESWVGVKGAPEAVLAICTDQWTEYDPLLSSAGKHRLNETDRQAILQAAAQMASEGQRLVAFAEKTLPYKRMTQEEAEAELVFVGLAGLADPPRPEARGAITACRRAGIRPVMVTGDHPLTAQAIARQVGLDGETRIMTGPELDRLSDEELARLVDQISIYARTTPEHKLRIVRAFELRGERVAVTGDGINDAPALAAADIGVAMGETGSDVAREAADIVLADDNFATIINAVSEGRLLFENLKKGVRYYLAVKVALVLVTLLPVLLRMPVPFAPIQIILMELFMDLAAAAAFVTEPHESDLMSQPPLDPKAQFMDQAMVSSIFTSAVGLFVAVSAVYLLTLRSSTNLVMAQTSAFAAWLVGHVLLAFNMRSARQPLFQVGFFSNRIMLGWGVSAILFVLLATILPILQNTLKTTPLGAWQWGLILGTTVVGTFWMEIQKLITYR